MKYIHWPRIDMALLHVYVIPGYEKRKAALEKIAAKEKLSVRTLERRRQYLGMRHIEGRMGPRAASAWLRHMKAIITLYRGNIQIHYKLVNRYEEVMKEQRDFLLRTFDDRAAARNLAISQATLKFWADTLGAIERDEHGRFTGEELRRFWEEDKHLLVAVRIQQRREAMKK